ncbi:MAG: hypothetical protein J6S91_05090, partial [Treponema sp.]|nr:hypothetical protein [Treponema sp.]
MKPYKGFVIAFLTFVLLALAFIGTIVAVVDPFFHYHKPLEGLCYQLSNERSINDGITKHFDYDAIITGSSMIENFKASEADKMFNLHFIKLPYSGGSLKEINDNLKIDMSHNRNLKVVIRSLDYLYIDNMGDTRDKNWMRHDLGDYPTYLYDRNIFNDVYYLLNRDVFVSCIHAILNSFMLNKNENQSLNFDSYGNWMSGQTFGEVLAVAERGPFS